MRLFTKKKLIPILFQFFDLILSPVQMMAVLALPPRLFWRILVSLLSL